MQYCRCPCPLTGATNSMSPPRSARTPLARYALRSIAAALLSMAATGCGATPVARAVLGGRMDEVRAAVVKEIERGRFGITDAAALARALLRSDVAHARGHEDEARLWALRSCARPIDDAFEKRSALTDPLGPIATRVRMEAGTVSVNAYRRWATASPGDPNAAWRSLGARSLAGSDDGDLRRALTADPDEDVRRAALRAALRAVDPKDTEAVLEAARLDPAPGVRSLAVRVAGALGGDRVVIALKDLWPHTDGPTREAIAAAWASPACLASGGARELAWAMSTERGLPAIAAALALLNAKDTTVATDRTDATFVVERAVLTGSTADRVRAIEGAPLAIAAISSAVAKAESDHDEAVAAAALAHRLEASPRAGGIEQGTAEYDARVSRLLTLAANNGPGAADAKGILARLGVQRLSPYLLRDGAASNPRLRAEAGTALTLLGDLPHAAVIAADADPQVRATVSCAILRVWMAW